MLSRHWAITHSLVLISMALLTPLLRAETSEGKTANEAIVELRVETGR